jgi:hypothetical protein
MERKETSLEISLTPLKYKENIAFTGIYVFETQTKCRRHRKAT